MASLSSNPAGEDAVSDVIALLERHYREHYDCEDCWYSCPKAEHCCNAHYDGVPREDRPCECGKDEADALVLRLKSERSFTWRRART